MKNLNVRISDQLHEAIFQQSLKESCVAGKRISMNNMICRALDFYIEARNRAADVEKTIAANGHNKVCNMNGAAGVSDNAVNTKGANGAISPNNGNGVNSVSDANGTQISLTEYHRVALLKGEKTFAQEIAKKYGTTPASVSSTKSRIKKKLVKQGLICV